ncbi:hypothetical protein ALC60_00679 [Trachymyrmex zeteki]|uniref:Uncharacterized protein n=1 Tax=Mycetomoellerius zeteki TaxID=64791 RepID=A0A151XIV0_9HYME|nr:hypothetical protein ALC60_00679 [Trachymyrmex zeteki]
MRCGPTEAAMKRDADTVTEYERANWQSVTASAASRVGDEETEVHRRRRDWTRRDSFPDADMVALGKQTDCEIRSIDMEVDSGRVARDGNVSIPRKQVLNASVTACSSSIGCGAANGDRDGTRGENQGE